MGPTPDTPLTAFFHESSTVKPRGFTVPIPVITILSIHSSQNLDKFSDDKTPDSAMSHALNGQDSAPATPVSVPISQIWFSLWLFLSHYSREFCICHSRCNRA